MEGTSGSFSANNGRNTVYNGVNMNTFTRSPMADEPYIARSVVASSFAGPYGPQPFMHGSFHARTDAQMRIAVPAQGTYTPQGVQGEVSTLQRGMSMPQPYNNNAGQRVGFSVRAQGGNMPYGTNVLPQSVHAAQGMQNTGSTPRTVPAPTAVPSVYVSPKFRECVHLTLDVGGKDEAPAGWVPATEQPTDQLGTIGASYEPARVKAAMKSAAYWNATPSTHPTIRYGRWLQIQWFHSKKVLEERDAKIARLEAQLAALAAPKAAQTINLGTIDLTEDTEPPAAAANVVGTELPLQPLPAANPLPTPPAYNPLKRRRSDASEDGPKSTLKVIAGRKRNQSFSRSADRTAMDKLVNNELGGRTYGWMKEVKKPAPTHTGEFIGLVAPTPGKKAKQAAAPKPKKTRAPKPKQAIAKKAVAKKAEAAVPAEEDEDVDEDYEGEMAAQLSAPDEQGSSVSSSPQHTLLGPSLFQILHPDLAAAQTAVAPADEQDDDDSSLFEESNAPEDEEDDDSDSLFEESGAPEDEQHDNNNALYEEPPSAPVYESSEESEEE